MEFSEKIIELLLKAGLTESEAQIYLNLLQNPAATKWELVKRTGFNKSKVYRSCDKLCSLHLIQSKKDAILANPLNSLIDHLNEQNSQNSLLIAELKQISPLQELPVESLNSVSVATTKEKICEQYLQMSEIPCLTCLDFGDLEGFVNMLGDLSPVLKFRQNRFKKMARNHAICTTSGPFTSCMARNEDLKNYHSKIEKKQSSFKGKWIIFSDTNDQIMINDFSSQSAPVSLVINSKLLADYQRLLFEQMRLEK